MNEFDYISWLRRQTPPDPRILVGPGDDCAVLHWGSAVPWLVTTDMLLEGTHFHLQQAGAYRVGRKALAVNLSDIAAMAGRPIAAFTSVAFPRGQASVPEDLYGGLRDLADSFGVSLAGGDTNSWDGGLAISVTLLGETLPSGPVLRSGALPGDWLFVTGPLGGSILGKHLDFTPRVLEAQMLAEQVRLHAMIDISDGLAADLGHIVEESGCGALLRAGAIPIDPAAQRLNDGISRLDHALGDGEDFELLFAVSPQDGQRLLSTQPIPGMTLHHIGECLDQPGMFLEKGGVQSPLSPRGYEHQI